MNRKLIRPNLAELKPAEHEYPHARESREQNKRKQGSRQHKGERTATAGQQAMKKSAPPIDTSAEVFYYKKQIEAQTDMTVVLLDGEEIEGTIEWYDRDAIKINRTNAPNVMLLKHTIKYMFKSDQRR